MPESPHEDYDCIIIGAGMSGLICGCYLAKAGLRVLLVEQHDKPGGYFTSFKRKGFLFDAAAHSFGNYREGGHVRKIFKDLGIPGEVNIERYDPSDIVITPDFKFAIRNNIHDTLKELTYLFPKEKNNIDFFFRFLTSGEPSSFVALRTKTFEQLLSDYFTDKKLINSLAFPVFGSGGLPPSEMQAFIGAKIFSEFILDGGYYPRGGMQTLPDALANLIQEEKGEILYKRRVKKILVGNNRAFGIEVDGSTVYRAKNIVSACDITETFLNLLPKEATRQQDLNALTHMLPSLSFFLLYIGLECQFEELPPKGTNVWHLNTYNLDELYADIQISDFNKSGSYLLRLSPDGNTLLGSFLANFSTPALWKQKKRKIEQLLLDVIAVNLPRLKQHISYFDAATPVTLHRYTRNYKGAAFGWSKNVSQVFNPLFTKKTNIDGLYFTGHWTSIGFGMPGACYSGRETAHRILVKTKKYKD